MDLNRLAFDCEIKLDAGDGDTAIGTVTGYGSVFGIMDRGGDVVEKGAFKKSLAEWKKKKQLPSMLWHHDTWQPIGVWKSIEEDDRGLKVEGQLVLDVQQAKEAHALVKAGAVKGLSIGYRAKEYEVDRATGVRHLKHVELWEISMVTFPMLPEAQMTGVKGDFDPQVWERAFRDEGLSHRDAKAAVAAARKRFLSEPPAEEADGHKELLMSLRRATEVVGT